MIIIIGKPIKNILTYGKWLLVKIPFCPKYVVISRPDGLGVNMILICGEFNDVGAIKVCMGSSTETF